MNFSVLSALQKLRYFLAASFPALARAIWPARTIERVAQRFPIAAARVSRARQSLLGGHVEKAAGVFAVGDYASDALDWTKVPSEVVPLLRGGVVVAGLLCLLLPAAALVDWPAVPIESITAEPGRGTVGGWDVVVWVVAMSLGWASLLIGTALANRVLFLPSLTAFLYFTLATVAELPKSYWSLLLPLQGFMATAYAVYRGQGSGRAEVARGLALSLVAAALFGFVGTIVIPTTPWFRGRIPLAIAMVGIPLGVITWAIGRWLRRRFEGGHASVAAALVTCVGILLHSVLAVRGGFRVPAVGVTTFGTQITGYLWPLFYFIGVGVVFKVLRQARTLQVAARELIPHAIAVPLTIAALLVSTAVLWAPAVVRTPGLPWPGWFMTTADALSGFFSVTWSTLVAEHTARIMRWVVLAIGLAAVWASRRGRLNARAIARVQIVTLVTWFAIAEYHMEWLGIARAPRVTATALFFFAIFIMWILHRTMQRFVVGDSPWWPRPARVCLYVAGLLFVLLPVHARGAMHDPRLSSELVYYLFQGVLVFGLPYYLQVYASRRFATLPMSPEGTLTVFLVGGGIAALLVALDRTVISGSLSAAWAQAGRQIADGIAGRQQPAQVFVMPAWWLAARSTLVVVAMQLVVHLVRRRTPEVALRPAAAVFGVVAIAAGMACFTNRALELPLVPSQVSLMMTPLRPSLWVDENFIAHQLSYLLPALVLGGIATSDQSRARALGAALFAIGLQVVIGLAWPGAEVWLRSSGMVGLVMSGGVGAFLLMASAIRDRLDVLLPLKHDDTPEALLPQYLLNRREVRLVAFAVVVLALGIGAWRGWRSRLIERSLALGLVPVPAHWEPVEASFRRAEMSGDTSTLVIDVREDTAGVMSLLQHQAASLSGTLGGFTPTGIQPLDHVSPGMVALDFTWFRHVADSTGFTLGTIAARPVGDGHLAVATATYGTGDANRRWDTARVLASLPVDR